MPRESRQELLTYLGTIRKNTGRNDPISLKQLSKSSGPLCRCISGWLQVGVAALLQKLKGKPYYLPTGVSGRHSEFNALPHPIGARFVLFRVRPGLSVMTLSADHGVRVETTFRMAFKGGLNLFSNDGHKLTIHSLHFDGYRHYGRRLDLSRILRDLGERADKFEIPTGITLHDASSDHRRSDSQGYDDCQLLQLTDLLVSGFRTMLGEATCEAQRQACSPLVVLAEKWNRGRVGFQNSRWHNGFCISEASIVGGSWQFASITPAIKDAQTELFDEQ